MAGRKDALKEDSRFRVLRLLEAKPEMSQRELAEAVGIIVGRAHYVLNELVERGLVKLCNFSASEDKRRNAYFLTPKGLAEKTVIATRFLARKLEECDALKREIEELRAEIGSGDWFDREDIQSREAGG